MEKCDMEALLDRVYELEGLLHLALTREDCPARLQEIIRLKGERIVEIIEAGGEVKEEHDDSEASEAVSAPDASPMLAEEEMMAEAWDEDDTPAGRPDAEPMLEEEDEMAEAWEEEDAPVAAPEPVVPEPHDTLEHHENHENHKHHEHHDTQDPVVAAEPKRSGHLKSRFSLNDRFRFSRELFGGDTRRFDAVVEQLNGAAGFDEARDYLVSDLAWDIEADDLAAEFVDIIKPFF